MINDNVDTSTTLENVSTVLYSVCYLMLLKLFFRKSTVFVVVVFKGMVSLKVRNLSYIEINTDVIRYE